MKLSYTMNNSGGPVARRKRTDIEDDIGEFGVQITFVPQYGSRHREPQHRLREQEEEEEGLQGRQKRRRWSPTPFSFPSTSMLKMSHADGGETSRILVNIRPRS